MAFDTPSHAREIANRVAIESCSMATSLFLDLSVEGRWNAPVAIFAHISVARGRERISRGIANSHRVESRMRARGQSSRRRGIHVMTT